MGCGNCLAGATLKLFNPIEFTPLETLTRYDRPVRDADPQEAKILGDGMVRRQESQSSAETYTAPALHENVWAKAFSSVLAKTLTCRYMFSVHLPYVS